MSAQVPYRLDAAGNLLSDGLRSFDYDAHQRLSQVRIGLGAEEVATRYWHNALGQRVFKSSPQALHYAPNKDELGESFIAWLQKNFGWLFDSESSKTSLGQRYVYADAPLPNWALLGEYGNGSQEGRESTPAQEYLWLPQDDGTAMPVGLYKNGNFYAIHADHLGTPRLITDSSNKVVWQLPYSVFGVNKPVGILKSSKNNQQLKATAPSINVNLRFPGQYFDAESNLSYNYFRSYRAQDGRYTQSDPIGLEGGINRFGYVGGDSLNKIDPEGKLFFVPAAVWWGSAALGTAGWAVWMSTPEGRRAVADAGAAVDQLCKDDDPCEEIKRQIRDIQAKLAGKEGQLAKDPYNLLNRAYSVNPGGDLAGKGTYVGHLTQIEGLRIGLARKIAQAKAMGCL